MMSQFECKLVANCQLPSQDSMRFAQQVVVASETISLSPRQTILGLGINDGLVGVRNIQTTGGMFQN
jgi:hypothetical protein